MKTDEIYQNLLREAQRRRGSAEVFTGEHAHRRIFEVKKRVESTGGERHERGLSWSDWAVTANGLYPIVKSYKNEFFWSKKGVFSLLGVVL